MFLRPAAPNRGVSLALVVALAAIIPACDQPQDTNPDAGVDLSRCPQPVPNWEQQQLSVDDMEQIRAQWPDELARELYAWQLHPNAAVCPPVSIGVDARNGHPLELRHQCYDICPESAQFTVTYQDCYGEAEAEAMNMCYLRYGMEVLNCLPIHQGGYSDCYDSL